MSLLPATVANATSTIASGVVSILVTFAATVSTILASVAVAAAIVGGFFCFQLRQLTRDTEEALEAGRA